MAPRSNESCQRLEQRLVSWMASHGVALLRISLGIVFLWFVALKFVPALSPARTSPAPPWRS